MSRQEDNRHIAGGRRDLISLVRVWPDIAETLAVDQRQIVERALVVPLLRAHDEDFVGTFGAESSDALWLAIVDGIVLKETTLATRSSLELLGPGDVLAPPSSAARQLESRAVSRYIALGDVSLAALGASFRRVAARLPPVSDFFHGRLAEQAQRTSMHIAMLHLPRAEDRIIALFTDLAERFGRVSGEGILVDVPLTHGLIGALVGSRRPTVSIALQALDDEGLLTKHHDDRWKLPMKRM